MRAFAFVGLCGASAALTAPSRTVVGGARAGAPIATATAATMPRLQAADVNTEPKLRLLGLAAALDRGQSYNPTSSDAYAERMGAAVSIIRDELLPTSPPLPSSLAALDGEWELAFTSVRHGIFRSSPFFLAIEAAYRRAGAPEKADLFFKLHELQTCSWGVSKIGRVAQVIDASAGMIYSEFDTNLLTLTVIPIIGWFKLLPTFGGCVITASSCELTDDAEMKMEVDYTTSRPVPGLSGLRPFYGEWGKFVEEKIWSLRVPVGAVWKLLPWNKGVGPVCSTKLVYFDGDWRVVEDAAGELFVYVRSAAPRPLPQSARK